VLDPGDERVDRREDLVDEPAVPAVVRVELDEPVAVYVLGRKVRTSQSAVITAAIVAPNAKLSFGRDATYNGCFCASQAKSDKHITLTCVE
jgi:hypothetical protein